MEAGDVVGVRRVFPEIGPNLYAEPAPARDEAIDRRLAVGLLALGRGASGGGKRGRGDETAEIRRLLHCHRLAIAAERDGTWERADFHWRELWGLLARLWPHGQRWTTAAAAVARDLGVTTDTAALDLRIPLLEELLLDTHVAFHLAFREAGLAAAPRARFHLEAIDHLLQYSRRDTAQVGARIAPLFAAEARRAEHEKRWADAWALADRLAKRFPDEVEWQELLISISFRRTMAKVEATAEDAPLNVAAALADGIAEVESLRAKHPRNCDAFAALAALHHARAVKLAGGGELAQALVAVDSARAFGEQGEDIDRTQSHLAEAMNDLQQQMRVVEATLARTPNATLNEQGQRLRKEAQLGFTAAETFRSSPQAKAIREARDRAQAADLWRRVGLPAPVEVGDEAMLALLRACGRVRSKPPRRSGGLRQAWAAAAAGEPALAGVDPAPVERFLSGLIFDQAPPAPEVATTTDDLALPAPFPGVATERRRGGPPLLGWATSRQNPWIKLQAVAAVVLLLTAAALTWRDGARRKARDRAWDHLAAASTGAAEVATIDAAAAFFATAAPREGDAAREQRAGQLYDEAIVHWFVDLPTPLGPENLSRLARYRAQRTTSEEIPR